jgi:succinate dehydrogenase / fumarate reductase flavoprotein subunit
LNTYGDRFMKRYAPEQMELATRSTVSLAIGQEILEGRGVDGCVLLDLRHLGRARILERLPQIRQLAVEFAGIDPIESPIPVRPGAHYQMGGIRTSLWGETDLPGLFAAGECACVSVHGANRLGGNSLLEAVVFGRRTGQRAAEYTRAVPPRALPGLTLRAEKGRLARLMANQGTARPWQLREELGKAMSLNLGIFRTKQSMEEALAAVRKIKDQVPAVTVADKGSVYNSELIQALELDALAELAEVIVAGALAREESRGAHYRGDFPIRDDTNWLKHMVARRTSHGPALSDGPVRITRFPPK